MTTASLERETALWRQAVSAHQRLIFLSEASRVLGGTLDARAIMVELVKLTVPKMAEWASVDTVSADGKCELVHCQFPDEGRTRRFVELRRRRAQSLAHPAFKTARAGRALMFCGGGSSYICAPLRVGGRCVAVFAMGRSLTRPMTKADLELVREVGQRAESALENAMLYDLARRADQMLSRALAGNRMAVWDWDSGANAVRHSSQAEALYGCAAPEGDLTAALARVHPDDRGRYETELANALERQASYLTRFRLIRGDGSVCWVEERGSVARGKASAISAVVMDITQQKLAEDTLKLQADLARVFAETQGFQEALSQALAVVGRTLGWSSGRAWLREGEDGVEVAAAWGPRGAESLTPTEADRRLIRSVWSSPKPVSVCDIRDGRSARFPRRLSCSFVFPILGGDEPHGLMEFRGDKLAVSSELNSSLFETLGRQFGLYLERRRAEEALDRQRRDQQEILDAVPAMIWYKDADNRVLRRNRAATLWHGDCLEEQRDDMAAVADGAAKLGFVERSAAPGGGDQWLRRDLLPRFDDKGKVVGSIAFAVDITEIKRAEDVLRESEQAQRDFVANVSHEFRTPVAAIKGFAETLRRGGLEDAENRMGFVRTIESHADRLDWLVQDLLNLSRLGSGMVKLKKEVLPARKFLAQYAESVASLSQKAGVPLEVEASPSLRLVADRPHLVQVLDNLVSNALRYSPKGKPVVLSARRDGRAVRLSVSDQGPGVPPEHLSRIFDRFFRVEKGDGGGSAGLGLHIVKAIVLAHGGQVWAENGPSAGASFHVRLPL